MRVVEARCEISRRLKVGMTRVSNVLNSEGKDYDLGLRVGVSFDSHAN